MPYKKVKLFDTSIDNDDFWKIEFKYKNEKYHRLVGKTKYIPEKNLKSYHDYEEYLLKYSKFDTKDYLKSESIFEIEWKLEELFCDLNEICFDFGVQSCINFNLENNSLPIALFQLNRSLKYSFEKTKYNTNLLIYDDYFRRKIHITNFVNDLDVCSYENILSFERKLERYLYFLNLHKDYVFRFCNNCNPRTFISERRIQQYLHCCTNHNGMWLCHNCKEEFDKLISPIKNIKQVIAFLKYKNEIYICSSSDLHSRIQSLKYQSKKIYDLIGVIPIENPLEIERELKKRFKKYHLNGKSYICSRAIKNYISNNCITNFLDFWKN